LKHDLSSVPMRFAYYLPVATTWQYLLASHLSDQQSIAEWGSGWSPKIVMALERIHYHGSFVAVDQSQDALNYFSAFVQTLNLGLKVETLCASFLTSIDDTYDVVILNHVFDDLLLWAYHDKAFLSYDTIYSKHDAVEKTWLEIEKHKHHHFQSLGRLLFEAFLTHTRPGGLVFLSQYASYQEKLTGGSLSVQLSVQLAKDTVQSLVESGHFLLKKETFLQKYLTISELYFGPNDCWVLERVR